MMLRRLAAATLVVALLSATRATADVGRPASEAEVKAAFIVGFMRFAQWAMPAAPEAGSPFVLCVLDDPAVLAALAAPNQAVTVRSRPVRVRSAPSDDISLCHVLYLGSANSDPRVAQRALEHQHILTVADVGAEVPAIIRFVSAGDRLAFDVDLGAARAARLDLGSQLLGVARRVIGRPAEKP